ncbi:MAG: hypothetical protein AB7G06_03240 [Bdellovibrionales bacterium]
MSKEIIMPEGYVDTLEKATKTMIDRFFHAQSILIEEHSGTLHHQNYRDLYLPDLRESRRAAPALYAALKEVAPARAKQMMDDNGWAPSSIPFVPFRPKITVLFGIDKLRKSSANATL